MATQEELTILLRLRDQAAAGLKKAGTGIDKYKAQIRGAGIAATALGGIVTGLAALAVKSSQDQQIGINRLDQALKNVGESYGAQKDQIEAVIASQQRKTNFGDEEQRDALQKLVTIGGTYENSLKNLVIAQDLAAGAGIDLKAASLLVGKAIAGETSSLSRYGIILEKGATQTEIMAALTRQFGGSAEAASDPMVQLKNRLGDMLQVIGDGLLPTVAKAAVFVENITRKVIEWTEAHPRLTKIITIVVASVGALLLVIGPLLIVLPSLVAGFGLLGAAITVATGPVGIIIVAIAALVAAGILLWKNWDTIWSKIGPWVEKAVNIVIKGINLMTLVWRKQFVVMLEVVKKAANLLGMDGFAGKVQVAIDALNRGIPEVDIFNEKVKETAQVVKTTADAVVESGERVQTSIKLTTEEVTKLTDEYTKGSEAIKRASDERAKLFQGDLDLLLDVHKREADAREKTADKIRDASKALYADVIKLSDGFYDDEAESLATFSVSTVAEWQNIRDGVVKANEEATKKVNKETERQAEAIRRMVNNVRGSLDSYGNNLTQFMQRFDPLTQTIKNLGLDSATVFRGIEATGRASFGELAAILSLAEIDFNNTTAVVEAFAKAFGLSAKEVVKAAAEMREGVKQVKDAAASLPGISDPNIGQRQAVEGQIYGVTKAISHNENRISRLLFNGSSSALRDAERIRAQNEELRRRLEELRSLLHSLRIPKAHGGGVVPGAAGTEQLVLARAGEEFLPPGRGGGITIQGPLISVAGSLLGSDVTEVIGEAFRELERRTGVFVRRP